MVFLVCMKNVCFYMDNSNDVHFHLSFILTTACLDGVVSFHTPLSGTLMLCACAALPVDPRVLGDVDGAWSRFWASSLLYGPGGVKADYGCVSRAWSDAPLGSRKS
jgi:hypothetical protein